MRHERILARRLGRGLGLPVELRLRRAHRRDDAGSGARFEHPSRRRAHRLGRRALGALGAGRDASVSHGAEWAVALRAADRRAGVDLERARRVEAPAWPLFLSEAECAQCRGERDALRLWTIKEAVFKAAGGEFAWFGGVRLDDPRARSGRAAWAGRRFRYTSVRVAQGWLTAAIEEDDGEA